MDTLPMRSRAARSWRWLILLAVPAGLIFFRSASTVSAGGQARPLLNLEAAFAFGLTALMILLATGGARPAPGPAPSLSRWFPLAIAMVVPIAYWRALHFGFVADDFVLVRIANGFRADQLWPLFTQGGGDGFYRPIGGLVWAAAARLAGWHEEYWRLVGWTIHAASGILVYRLAQRIGLSQWEALFAAVLFEIHGSNPETVVWISSLFQLSATFFTLVGLNLFLSAADRTRASARVFLCCSGLAMVLAILSKESAYAFPILLAILSAVRGDRVNVWLRKVIPFAAVAGVLFGYRLWLFGGLGGYRSPAGNLQAVQFGWPTLNALFGRLWAILYFPVNWEARPGPALIGLAAFYLICLAAILLGRPPRRQLAGAAAYTAIAALPALPLLLIGADLEKSRMLYLPSVGFAIMMATMVFGVPRPLREVVIVAILAFQMAALQNNISQWGRVSDKVRTTCDVAARCGGSPGGLPRAIRGVPFLGSEFFDGCVERAAVLQGRSLNAKRSGTATWDAANEQLVCKSP
jgi:hypothetical protein